MTKLSGGFKNAGGGSGSRPFLHEETLI